MPHLPTGTIPFLFINIEGSTKLWEQRPDLMRAALAGHDALDSSGKLNYLPEPGNKEGIAYCLISLGLVAHRQDDYESARALYAEALSQQRDLGDKLHIASSLENLTRLAQVQGKAAQAACLLGAAEAVHETIGDPRPTIARDEYEQTVAAVRNKPGKSVWAQWAQGRALTLRAVTAYALQAQKP